MTDLGIFLYPWDAAHDGPGEVVARLADLGVSRINIATAYHSAETLAPVRTRQVFHRAEANVLHMPVGPDNFSDAAIPQGTLATQRPEVFPELADAARTAGIRLSSWIVTGHNSSLAQSDPDLAIENCFGDRSTHGLCPANPRSVALFDELVGGVVATGLFDEVFVESLSYLLWGHGHPHELWAVRLDPVARYLLSLCFCSHCITLAGEAGTRLRPWVVEFLHTRWNDPISVVRDAGDAEELTALLTGSEDLATYTSMRLGVVAALSQRIVDTAHAGDTELVLTGAVWGRPASLNWTEGIDPGRIAAIADVFTMQAYHATLGEVAAELDVVRGLVGNRPARLRLAQTLWPDHHASVDVLLAKVDAAVTLGVEAIDLYNYGMAPAPMIGWIGEVARLLGRL